ncbi:hypothetical protein SAMN05192529_10414 [Arachidicoccus rhizosphaerae]|uniref:Uncharacterized protein n=1 Tax=Arachidicoccus rhizosphaerae TaxID=551991 RepID=A0A1H3WX33_9BACT|nr:hypothetical protein [Arachidicoccus rhizosphaerae]SDZ90892.1 hypothetical protein SAMN05192529_10414 [Arachidicoccus rhizosphaerae]
MKQATRYRWKTLFLAVLTSLLLLLLPGCHKHPSQNIKKAFYYWKTNFHLTAYEQSRLSSLNAQGLYVRFFDIIWDTQTNEPKPVAVSNINKDRPGNYHYTPVLFITQEVLSKINDADLRDFVKNFTNLLYEKCIQSDINPTEIQIDCDWTRSTKQKYFKILALCKTQSFFKDKQLSCTIRLHQIRYPQISGIPPVDKGLLMCYNMGNLKLPGNNNSILDLQVTRKYLIHLKDYPLNLDIAFPIFSWSLLYDDKNRFTAIVRDLTQTDLRDSSIFEPIGQHLYRIKVDTLWHGYPLKNTSIIRHESCSPDQLYQLAQLIQGKTHHTTTLIFYHLDSLTLTKYTNNELEKIYNTVL